MPNIKFNYLYRDAGNYKTFGSVVFINPNNYSLLEIETIVRSKLIDGLWFYAKEWQVPDLHTHLWDEDLDHGFHEFEGLDFTDEQACYLQHPFTLNLIATDTPQRGSSKARWQGEE